MLDIAVEPNFDSLSWELECMGCRRLNSQFWYEQWRHSRWRGHEGRGALRHLEGEKDHEAEAVEEKKMAAGLRMRLCVAVIASQLLEPACSVSDMGPADWRH